MNIVVYSIKIQFNSILSLVSGCDGFVPCLMIKPCLFWLLFSVVANDTGSRGEHCQFCSFGLFQVRSDYMRDLADLVDTDVAIKLGCIEMRSVSVLGCEGGF